MSLRLIPPEDPFEHIHPELRHLALADRATRKAAIFTDRWVDYPAGLTAIARLFELYDMPRRTRMPSILFWADSNGGKSFIQEEFIRRVERREVGEGGPPPTVLRCEMNSELNEKRLYIDLLAAMKVKGPESATAPRLQSMVLTHLEARGVRVIILEELQRAVELRPRDRRIVMDSLRYISNKLAICMAGFGSHESKEVIDADDHLRTRFEVIELPRWSRREKWTVELVKGRIAYMPLKRATKVDRAFMDMLDQYTEGSLGRAVFLLERCGAAALENEEHITIEMIEAVARGKRGGDDDQPAA